MTYSLDIRNLARALGGEVNGRDNILAPGPGHSQKDRSLSVTLSKDAPGGFLVNSFAGDDPLVCRDLVRTALGLPAWSPRSGSGGKSQLPNSLIRQRVTAVPYADEERRAAWVQARVTDLWEGAQDPRGSVVDVYLQSRKLTLPDEVAGLAIRFHPAMPWKEQDGKRAEVPAMVAAMRCIRTDKLKAIHRTRLTPDGRKVDRRMFGDAAETAVKLDPDDAVSLGLTVGEGIETTLAARQLGFRPAWALGSVSTLGTFPVLAGIEGLSLLAETDKSGANAKAIHACGTRWHEAGRTVVTVASLIGGDINDAVRGRVA